MKNQKVNSSMEHFAQKLVKEQIIQRLKQKNLKGGISCPPPFEINN